MRYTDFRDGGRGVVFFPLAMHDLGNASSQTGRGKVSVSEFISPSLPFSKFHFSSNFAADAKISKAREGGTGIYTPIPAVPNKRPAESAQHHSFAARWLYRE